MADLEVLYDRDDALSSASYGTTSTASISGASLGTKEWLGVAVGHLGGNSANANGFYLDVQDPDLDAAIARIEPGATTDDDLVQYGVLRRFTGDSTTPFEVAVRESAFNTAYVRESAVMAFDLDALTENTDYWWDENTTLVANHGTTMTDRASVTITPAANSKLLVMAYGEIDIDDLSVNYELEINEDGTERAFCSLEGEDTIENRSHLMMWVDTDTGAATSRTYALATRDDATGNNQFTRGAIFVLDLAAFVDQNATYDSTEAPTSPHIWNTVGTFTHTPTTTGDQIVIGGMSDDPGAMSYQVRQRFTFDSVLDVPVEANLGGYTWDNEDERCYALFTKKSVADSGDVIDFDADANNNSHGNYNHISLVAFSVAMAAGGTDAEVTPTALAATTSIPAVTVGAGAGVSPTAVAATVAMPAATASASVNAEVTPTAVAATAALPAPTLGAGAGWTATALAATTLIPTPTAGISVAVTPTALAATVALPAPTLGAGAGWTSSALAATTTIPAPTLGAGAGVTLTALAATAALPAPTLGIDHTVTPTALAATVALPAPTLTAGVAITPTAVALVVALPTAVAATSGVGANVSPTALAAVVTIPTATIGAGAGVSPTALAAVVAIATPTVTAGGLITGAAVVATVTIPTPTIAIIQNATVTPTAIAVVISIGTVVVYERGAIEAAMTHAMVGASSTMGHTEAGLVSSSIGG